MHRILKHNIIEKKSPVEWLLNEFQDAHKDFGGLDLESLKKFDEAKKMETNQKKKFIDMLQKVLIHVDWSYENWTSNHGLEIKEEIQNLIKTTTNI